MAAPPPYPGYHPPAAYPQPHPGYAPQPYMQPMPMMQQQQQQQQQSSQQSTSNVVVVNSGQPQQSTNTIIVNRRGVNHCLHCCISLFFFPWVIVWIILCITDRD